MIRNFFKNNDRTGLARRQVLLSVVARGISVLSSFLIVPLTIDYVNQTQYGIWLTLSSVVAWVSFFDLGLGNGFRNRYAVAKAENNLPLCRQYISTTYFAIAVVVSLLFVIAVITNNFIDWTAFLKVDSSYYLELRKVFGILCCFFCLNMVVNIFSTFLTAEQRPGTAALVSGAGQLASLAVIFILTKFTAGSLTNLALYFSGVPCFVMLVASIIAFGFTKYKTMRPSFKCIDIKLIKDILGIGVKFFLIYMCMLVVFQTINIIISRELGAEAVTQYNVANKLFNVIYMTICIIVTPYWTAFTDAYAKKDISWMKDTVRRLEKIWLLFVAFSIILCAGSDIIYGIWVGESVTIPVALSISMMIFVAVQSISVIYMYLINGVGTITLQLIIYMTCAVLAIPVMIFACRHFGLAGALIAPVLTYAAQAVFGKIQLNKLLMGCANGIWGK